MIGEQHLQRVRRSGTSVIFTGWHEQLLAPLWHRRDEDITLLVSGHQDGRLLARTAKRWGYRVVHGSSTRGGTRGLRGLIRTLQAGADVAVTPDGPRGPARVAKPGVLAAARHSGASIVPVAAHASAAWRARSWDGFVIPAPFARVRIAYGPPIGAATCGHERELLERGLRQAESAARW